MSSIDFMNGERLQFHKMKSHRIFKKHFFGRNNPHRRVILTQDEFNVALLIFLKYT